MGTGSVFASRARLSVSGSGDALGILDAGSLSANDVYNVFYNPVYINDFKNMAIIEKYNGQSGAMGGFTTGISNFNIGVFMNKANTVGYTNGKNFRNIDVIVGGDAGFKWGLGLSYGSNYVVAKEAQDLNVNLGLDFDGISPFINFKAIGEEKDVATSTKGKFKDMAFGLRYKMGEWTPYAMVRMMKTDPATTESTGIVVGANRTMNVADAAVINYGLAYSRHTIKNGAKEAAIPMWVVAESDVADFLALRAGVHYQVYHKTSGVGSAADNTSAVLGATFKHKKAALDWAIGNSNPGHNPATPGDDEFINSKTFSLAQGFFTQASLSYSW
jgi:hypothetical protein